MAVPILVDYTSNNSGDSSAASLVMTKPSPVNSGDLLLMIMSHDGNDLTDLFQPITGWDRVNSNTGIQNLGVMSTTYWRISDGTENAFETVELSAGKYIVGFYCVISGASTATPFHTIGSWIETISSSSITVPSETSTVDNCLAMYMAGGDGGDTAPLELTVANGFVKNAEETRPTPAATGLTACFGTKDMLTAGETGLITITPAVSDGLIANIIIIESNIVEGVTTQYGDIQIDISVSSNQGVNL